MLVPFRRRFSISSCYSVEDESVFGEFPFAESRPKSSLAAGQLTYSASSASLARFRLSSLL
jgi:hypothetical protein